MSKTSKGFSLELFLIIAIAITCILRIINLDSREFWYDEVLSLLLSTGQKKLYNNPSDVPVALASYQPLLSLPLESSFGDVLATFEKLLKGLVAEPHPPLFFIEQHIALRLFGNSEFAMRIFPTLYSFGAMFCAYGIGRKLLNYRGGLLFSATLGLNPFFLFHSLNVRMYCGLVFWVILSGWATLELFYEPPERLATKEQNDRQNRFKRVIWSLVLVASITAGIMTFYYFAIWVTSLGLFVVILDFIKAYKLVSSNKAIKNSFNSTILTFLKAKRWQYQSLLLIGGFIITIPWLLWGMRQQLNNADLGRFKAGSNVLETAWTHIQGILTTLGINLLTGDWASILTPTIINLTGFIAIALLLISIISLWQKKYYQLLITTICFSLLPLFIMVAVDVFSGKFTVGFGFGRSLIFILPGCLLLWVAAINKMNSKWQTYLSIALLSCYLISSVADFSLRKRSMFHDIADIIIQQPNVPTLIAMDSSAWGHVLRLAYYLPENAPIDLLAQPSSKLNNALINTFKTQPKAYQRLIFLNSDRPVWSDRITQKDQQIIQNTITKKFNLVNQKRLIGTWELDNFDLSVYEKP